MQRTALITGASRGLARRWPSPSLKPATASPSTTSDRADRAITLCDTLTARGLIAQPFQADVRDEAAVTRLVAEVTAALGPIDILVINATGHQPMLSIEQQTWQSYLDQLEFFLKSPLLLTQAVLPPMRAQRFGRIIQIGSEVVELGNPRFANYVAAKAAQLGQTRSWARELGPSGITVNLVAPGWIPTDRSLDATTADLEAYIANVPVARTGLPEEVARVVAFLASDAASFINGQKIAVNGGNTLV